MSSTRCPPAALESICAGACQRVVLWQQHDERFVVERACHHIRFGKGQCHEDSVQLSAAQFAAQAGSVVFLDKQRHFRRQLLQAANQSGKQVGTHGIDRTDGEHAAQRILAQFRQVTQVLCFPQHRAGLLHNALTGGGGRHLVARAFEQADAQFLLQFLDGNTQRGLADIALLSRFAKVACFRQGHKVAQFC